jgi:hypothetical protein
MEIRDRIKELRRVKASQLRPHPKNWRIHPRAQQEALRGLLAEIGYAAALLARVLPDGSLELIDGHLRAETTPDTEVPVLIVDLDEPEAAKLLALHDPLASMAETDQTVLASLLGDVDSRNASVQTVLAQLLAVSGVPCPTAPESAEEIPIPEAFQVVIECRDEDQQRGLFERLKGEGYRCRLLNL